jgi:hypothetical protein
MKLIEEYQAIDCDIAVKGAWHDGTAVTISAFSLSDERSHTAWYIKLDLLGTKQ